jgi:hypothetical protein
MFTATLRGGHPYRITAMRKTFLVEIDHDEAADLVSIEIKCAPNMVPVAMDVVRMQNEAQASAIIHQLQEGPVAPPLQPRNLVPLHQPNIDAWVDAEWKERERGPVLPNTRGF